MVFVRGREQQEFVSRVREVGPQRCVLMPVDVGKSCAMAMIADADSEVLVGPFEFSLTGPGVQSVIGELARIRAERDVALVRVGVEAAGHYHRTLVARLREEGLEVVELNPAAVAEVRASQGLRRIKTDVRDLYAMAELLARGGGRMPLEAIDTALLTQAAWVGHRRRKINARRSLQNQIHAQLDLIFPGLTGCFDKFFQTKAGPVIAMHIPDPDRIRHLGPARLCRYTEHRGVRLCRPKAVEIVAAAGDALALPAHQRRLLCEVLTADMALYDQLCVEIGDAETELADILNATPAAILTTLPGVGVIRASAYGAALGHPNRYHNAAAAYRASGLVPAEYASAGHHTNAMPISREGSVALRNAIMELGRGLAQHDPDFAAYRNRLVTEEKKHKGVAAVAVARRAHRLAFAMLQNQEPYDPQRWAESVEAGRSAMARPAETSPPEKQRNPPARPEVYVAEGPDRRRAEL